MVEAGRDDHYVDSRARVAVILQNFGLASARRAREASDRRGMLARTRMLCNARSTRGRERWWPRWLRCISGAVCGARSLATWAVMLLHCWRHVRLRMTPRGCPAFAEGGALGVYGARRCKLARALGSLGPYCALCQVACREAAKWRRAGAAKLLSCGVADLLE